MCPYNCESSKCQEVNCPPGVMPEWDGCRCCKTCPRGQGDICDFQHPCSNTLTCSFTEGTNVPGICRSNKTCILANGNILQDGESFQPHCSMQCSCQGGLVGCASLCQNDARYLALAATGACQRIRIPNRCCPQWVCEHTSPTLMSSIFFGKGLTTSAPKVDSNVKVHVEYAEPLMVLHRENPDNRVKTSQMRSMDSPVKSSQVGMNCTGNIIDLRSCSKNGCGLRITDDFSAKDATCSVPPFAYCMLRPCAKKQSKMVSFKFINKSILNKQC